MLFQFHPLFASLLSTFGKSNLQKEQQLLAGYNSGASTLNRNTIDRNTIDQNSTFDRRRSSNNNNTLNHQLQNQHLHNYAYTSPRHRNTAHGVQNTGKEGDIVKMQQQSGRVEGSMAGNKKSNYSTNNNSNTNTPSKKSKNTNNNQSSSGCTVSSSNLIQATILLIIMLAAALAGLAFLVKQLAKLPASMVGDAGVAHRQSQCRTKLCRKLDADLSSVMEPEVSVCNNSYHYFCGRYTSLDSNGDELKRARTANISAILSSKQVVLEQTNGYRVLGGFWRLGFWTRFRGFSLLFFLLNSNTPSFF